MSNETKENRRRTVVHEAGHAVVALHLKMLGSDGISINDESHGQTDIEWPISDFCNLDRLHDRITVLMAGLAADQRSGTNRNWAEVCCEFPEVKPDITKACRLAWIHMNMDLARRDIIEPVLQRNMTSCTRLDENQIDCAVANYLMRNGGYCWNSATPYFETAKQLLTRHQFRCFVKRASLSLQTKDCMSRKECEELWQDCTPNVFCQLYEWIARR